MSSLSIKDDTTVAWVFVAVCIVASGVRYALRGFVIRSWYWDDLAHGVALILFIATAAAATGAIGVVNAVTDKSNHNPQKYHAYFQLNVAFSILTFSCFYAVKIAFLLFYRLLFKSQKWFLRGWWAVLVFTILSYWATVMGNLVSCGGSAAYVLNEEQCSSAFTKELDPKIFIYTFCLNVASDLAIMILPLCYVSRLRISFQRKLGVCGVFCVGLVIIAFECLRLGESIAGTAKSNNSLWAFLESGITVLASCLPTSSAIKIWKPNGHRSSNKSGYALQSNAGFTARRPSEASELQTCTTHSGSLKAKKLSGSKIDGGSNVQRLRGCNVKAITVWYNTKSWICSHIDSAQVMFAVLQSVIDLSKHVDA